MDWNLAVEKNIEALSHIVAGLFATLGWVPGSEQPEWISSFKHRHLARILPAAEAALRRVIVLFVSIRGITAPAPRPSFQPLPDFAAFTRKLHQPRFNLFDPRKPMTCGQPSTLKPEDRPRGIPLIWTLDTKRRTGLHPEEPSRERDAGALLNRLTALDHALKTLPAQARRLARIMKRRKAAPPGPLRVGPIRPGTAPGRRRRSIHEVDYVLRECQLLVRDLAGSPP